MQTCKKCKSQYEVKDSDKAYFDKIKMPTPVLCPACMFVRLTQFRNERTLYQRTCDLCNKNMVTCIHKDEPYKVYCRDCYISDKWDARDYAMDYDSTRPFFDQLKELVDKVPKQTTTLSGTNENSDFTNMAGYNTNCYLVFNTGYCEDAYYSRGLSYCKESVDCYFGKDQELVYEVVNGKTNYNVAYSDHAYDCRDSWFLFDCRNCSDCFGCVNLRNKQYYFYNEQLTKEDYKKKMEEIHGSHKSVEEHKKRFREFIKKQPVALNHNFRSEDCDGNYIVSSKNCKSSYEVFESEDGEHLYFIKFSKDCRYQIGHGYYSELLYNGVATGGKTHSSQCTYEIEQGVDLQYAMNIHICNDLFGCDGLKNTHHSILNKQYEPEEYKKLRAEIIEKMKTEGDYGLYFPPNLSPFCYNETIAQDFYPLTKEKALEQGFRWRDDTGGTRGKETLRAEDIPDNIKDVQDSVTGEMLACASCGNNYKIIKQELEFYKKRNLPLPRQCFNCRHLARMERRGPFALLDRACNKCSAQMKTTYNENRAPTLYCEKCFQEEMV